MELHIKHVAKVMGEEISGRKQTGPINTLFKRLKDGWPELLPMIDLNELNKFDWKAVDGTEMEDLAQKSLEILSSFLAKKTFGREDYKELCELAVMYLGGAVPAFKLYGTVHLQSEDGLADGQDQLDVSGREAGGEGHGRVHLHLLCCLVAAGLYWGKCSNE